MSTPTEEFVALSQPAGFQDKVNFIWSVADLLRGSFRPHENGQIVLPFTVLRRVECALEPTKDKVLHVAAGYTGPNSARDAVLKKAAGKPFLHHLIAEPDASGRREKRRRHL